MENRQLLVLEVCDGGVMMSSMIANKIETLLSATEHDVSVVSLLPMFVELFYSRTQLILLIA